jgi:uncharacterized membrane protein
MTLDPSPRPYAPPPWATRGGATIERLAVGMFFLLAVEFVLGMTLGLFATFSPNSSVVAILTSNPVLDLHILLALLIIGIAIRAMTLARGEHDRTPLFASALALVSAIIATISGWAFTFDGQNSGASFVMALGFLGVLAGAFILRGPRSGQTSSPGASMDTEAPRLGFGAKVHAG